MTDLLARLTDARPTDVELDAMWSPTDRDARLRTVLADRGPQRWRRPALLAAAAMVAAAVVVPPVLGSGDATAADLHALALSAASYDGSVLEAGAWLHVRLTSQQRNPPTSHEDPVYDHEYESWTRWDGRWLVIDHQPVAGWTSYERGDDDNPGSYQSPTPQFAATLPGTADGLLAYLEPRVFGSSSHQEALYSALVQLATSHTLPPRTLAAAFEALAEVDDVETSDVSVEGTAAVEIRFTDEVTTTTERLVVDRVTGQVLATRSDSGPDDSYASTTTLSEVVPEVPAAVLEAFRTHETGVRYDATGAPLPD